MRKTLVTTAVALGIGLLGTAALAGDDLVNGHAASTEEAQPLVSHGVQRGQWVVDGYDISPAPQRADGRTTQRDAVKCWYVLDVLLCD
jgi:hypothetical protein